MLHIAIGKVHYAQERALAGKLANALGYGGQSFVAALLRGRKGSLELYPSLEKDIRDLMQSKSMCDPKFKNDWQYSSLSLREITEELSDRYGYTSLPKKSALYTALDALGYRLKPVQKAKPFKKIPETDLIFYNIGRVRSQAEADENAGWISIGCKDKVDIGPYFRGGKSRTGAAGADHDFKPQTQLTPFGILDMKSGQAHITMAAGPATADFMADCIEEWIDGNMQGKKALYIFAGNGMEGCLKRRQWVRRMLQISAERNIAIVLAYYPPYHSKYSPIERVWGRLECHWNGVLLNTVQDAVGYAITAVFNGKKLLVRYSEKKYEKGISASNKASQAMRQGLCLIAGIEQWHARIEPESARKALACTDETEKAEAAKAAKKAKAQKSGTRIKKAKAKPKKTQKKGSSKDRAANRQAKQEKEEGQMPSLASAASDMQHAPRSGISQIQEMYKDILEKKNGMGKYRQALIGPECASAILEEL